MLKPGTCDELTEAIRAVVLGRYVKDSPPYYGSPAYVHTDSENGLTFASLPKADRLDLILEHISWKHYVDKGIGEEHGRVIIGNVVDGKPQEKWFEEAFDNAVLESHRIASFKAMVEDSRNSPSNHFFEEMDSDRRPWAELSAAAKLQYIARDAVFSDVPFEPFAQVVKETIVDAGEAALKVVLESQKELHAIEELLPDDRRIESTPLVERVKDTLDYVSALETREEERRHGREKLFEGISDVLDGKTPQAWSEAAKLFRDILRNGQPTRNEGEHKERGGRDIS